MSETAAGDYDVSREQSRDIYAICHRSFSHLATKAVQRWYEDMAERTCKFATRRKSDKGGVLVTLLRTCVDGDATMVGKFRDFFKAQFTDCTDVYQRLFVAKSRLLASSMTAPGGGKVKFQVPTCDTFLSRLLSESAKVAKGNIDAYTEPDIYERESTHIGTIYYRAIKGLLDSCMPLTGVPEAVAAVSEAAAVPDVAVAAVPPQPLTEATTGNKLNFSAAAINWQE